MSDGRSRLSVVGIAPLLALVALLAGVGAVAMYAEAQRNWGSYFLMEQAMSAGASAALPLLALALLSGFAVVVVAPRHEGR